MNTPPSCPGSWDYVSPKDIIINSLISPHCRYAELDFQIAFTHLVVFYFVRAQEKWSGTCIITLWSEKPRYTEEEMITVNVCGTLTCQEVTVLIGDRASFPLNLLTPLR